MLEFLRLVFRYFYEPKKVSLIVSIDSRRGISKNNHIPWNIPDVKKWFDNSTQNNIVIMGGKTFVMLGFKPLSNRMNIVITKDPKKFLWLTEKYNNLRICTSINEALVWAHKDWPSASRGQIFIIGGATIFNTFLEKYSHLIKNYYVSLIRKDFNCDRFLSYVLGWKVAMETELFHNKTNNFYYRHQVLIKI